MANCNARSSNEILQEYAEQIKDVWGDTPLANPAENISDPLVTLLSGTALAQSQLEQRLEAFLLSSNFNNLSGSDLTNYAAARGIVRQTGTKSKAIIIVTGDDGAVLDAGSLMTDKSGNAWQVVEDIRLTSTGTCAVGSGCICAVSAGCLTLKEGEIFYDNSNNPCIFNVTNTLMVSYGGQLENDQQLRERLACRSPFTCTTGHHSAALNDLKQIDGVIYAKYEKVESCIGDGWMFIVKGGDESKICDTIRKHTTTCNLVGGTSCPDTCLEEIKFQKASPVGIKVNLRVTEGCPYPDIAKLKSLVASQSSRLAPRSVIHMIDIAKLDPVIEFVDFQRLPCPCEGALDPFTGEELVYEDGMIHQHHVECNKVNNKLELAPWEFPVICEVEICGICESLFNCDDC